MNPEQLVEATVQHFTLRPGEIVVLTYPGDLTLQEADAVKKWWDSRFPDNYCMVMTKGGHVSGVLEVAS